MGGESMRSSTETLIEALRILANEIQSEDGVANAAIAEAADRMEELCSELLFQKRLAEKYVKAGKICAKIYIARNISLSEKCIVSALAELDKLYRTQHDGN
jgi:hypothetical protein